MTYAAVAAAWKDDVKIGQVQVGLAKKAGIRIGSLTKNEDQRERKVCNSILNAMGVPPQYTLLVLTLADMQAINLATLTDAQIDATIETLWPNLVALEG